jgi:hypothetical protein
MTDARAATATVAAPPAHTPDDGPYDVGVTAYLASADRMLVVADVVLKGSIALALLVLAAWVLGLLPGAVRLF